MSETNRQIPIHDQAAFDQIMRSGIANDAKYVLRQSPQVVPSIPEAKAMALEAFLLNGQVISAAKMIAIAPDSTIQLLREQRRGGQRTTDYLAAE